MAETEDSREKRRAYHRVYMRGWNARNPEKVKETAARKYRKRIKDKPKRVKYTPEEAHEQDRINRKKWVDTHPEKAREISLRSALRWAANNPDRIAYKAQKQGAGKRGIAFLLTFEEWSAIWAAAGGLEKRGSGLNDLCMARTGDLGPYAIGNIRICTNQENWTEAADRLRGKPLSEQTRKLLSDKAKARHAKKGCGPGASSPLA